LIGARVQGNQELNLDTEDRWGTKSDVMYCHCDFEIRGRTIVMSPDTAWSPPIQFCQHLSEKFKVDVDINYSEPGCNFAGRTMINKKGVVIMDENYSYTQGKYILNNKEFWTSLINNCLIGFILEFNKEEIKEMFSYVSEEDMITIIKIFNDEKEK